MPHTPESPTRFPPLPLACGAGLGLLLLGFVFLPATHRPSLPDSLPGAASAAFCPDPARFRLPASFRSVPLPSPDPDTLRLAQARQLARQGRHPAALARLDALLAQELAPALRKACWQELLALRQGVLTESELALLQQASRQRADESARIAASYQALAGLLQAQGHLVDGPTLLQESGTGQADLTGLVTAARAQGYTARPIPPSRLEGYPWPVLARLRTGEWVVLEAASPGRVLCREPARGRHRRYALPAWLTLWDGSLLAVGPENPPTSDSSLPGTDAAIANEQSR